MTRSQARRLRRTRQEQARRLHPATPPAAVHPSTPSVAATGHADTDAPAGKGTRRHVYVAGPISSDPQGCAREAMRVGALLLDAGLVPFVPHLSVWWGSFHPQPYETWMTWDFAWLRRCDALLRLPGHSPGADREVALARERGMPVFLEPGAVIAWAQEAV